VYRTIELLRIRLSSLCGRLSPREIHAVSVDKRDDCERCGIEYVFWPPSPVAVQEGEFIKVDAIEYDPPEVHVRADAIFG